MTLDSCLTCSTLSAAPCLQLWYTSASMTDRRLWKPNVVTPPFITTLNPDTPSILHTIADPPPSPAACPSTLNDRSAPPWPPQLHKQLCAQTHPHLLMPSTLDVCICTRRTLSTALSCC